MSIEPVAEDVERIGRAVVQAAYTVHRVLGPGLLESVYHTCLGDELTAAGLQVSSQVPIPVVYRQRTFQEGFRADLIVERSVIVEVKAVEAVKPVHEAQLLTYLRLSGLRLGFLINFTAPTLKAGLRRIIF